MKIPRTIKVGKLVYDIVYVDTIPNPPRFGAVDTHKRQIVIAHGNAYGNYASLRKQETFLHELTHAILYDMGFVRKHPEDFVERFATRLLSAINSAEL